MQCSDYHRLAHEQQVACDVAGPCALDTVRWLQGRPSSQARPALHICVREPLEAHCTYSQWSAPCSVLCTLYLWLCSFSSLSPPIRPPAPPHICPCTPNTACGTSFVTPPSTPAVPRARTGAISTGRTSSRGPRLSGSVGTTTRKKTPSTPSSWCAGGRGEGPHRRPHTHATHVHSDPSPLVDACGPWPSPGEPWGSPPDGGPHSNLFCC